MRRLLSRWIVRGLRDAGTNMIEAAIITPLLLLLTFGIVDFASLFYVYLAMENGVSQATRYGITGQTMGGLSHTDSMIAVMRAATPTLTIPDGAFTFRHMSLGGSTWVDGDGGPNDIEEMQVDYDWALMTPLIKPFFPGGVFHVTVDSTAKNEPPVNPNQ